MNSNILLLFFIDLILTLDVQFYYNTSEDKVEMSLPETDGETILYSGKNQYKIKNELLRFKTGELLNSETSKEKYKTKAKNGVFFFDFYELKYNETLVELVKISWGEGDLKFSEVVISAETEEECDCFPDSKGSFFKIKQSKEASKLGSIERKVSISDTYGFSIEPKFAFGKINKILLLHKRKGKYDYFTDVTDVCFRTFNESVSIPAKNVLISKIEYFNFNLISLPESFELHITIEVTDDKGKNTEKDGRILYVIKEINYPNFTVEDANPNKIMFVVSVSVIGVAFVLTVILLGVKLYVL